jgi:hypothetical protein
MNLAGKQTRSGVRDGRPEDTERVPFGNNLCTVCRKSPSGARCNWIRAAAGCLRRVRSLGAVSIREQQSPRILDGWQGAEIPTFGDWVSPLNYGYHAQPQVTGSPAGALARFETKTQGVGVPRQSLAGQNDYLHPVARATSEAHCKELSHST